MSTGSQLANGAVRRLCSGCGLPFHRIRRPEAAVQRRNLRSLLVLGAKALLAAAKKKTDVVSRWAIALAERRGYWRAVVAIAAKNARMAWAMLRRGDAFALPA